ncbi:LysR family transcriptional regulator [Solibacillus sp. CAU 1738]|uniref:LysR family transcriptional regulator n=1 Tax=Solibacillus sp. CAU 1738 TaxID=3140363 RepID=UPI003261D4DE
MDYRWIQSFITAAKTCNFRKAAEELHLSQPSITVHIHQLEQFLQIELFKREKNRVQLTDAGKIFLTEAEAIASQWNNSLERFRLAHKGFKEKCIIAMTPLMVETILPHVIYQFINDNPLIDVSILVEDSKIIEQLIAEGKAHVGVSLLPASTREIHQELLFESKLEFVIPLDSYDDETGEHIDFDVLFSKYAFFTHHHPTIWGQLSSKIKQHYPFSKQIQISQSYVVKRLIKDGLGMSFLPKVIVHKEQMEGRFNIVPFDPFVLPPVPVYLMYKDARFHDAELMKLIKTRYYV